MGGEIGGEAGEAGPASEQGGTVRSGGGVEGMPHAQAAQTNWKGDLEASRGKTESRQGSVWRGRGEGSGGGVGEVVDKGEGIDDETVCIGSG